MSVAQALARRGEESRAVFYSVTMARSIANVTVERAVELHMKLHGIDMERFEAVLDQYKNCARDARDLMKIPDLCKGCPEV